MYVFLPCFPLSGFADRSAIKIGKGIKFCSAYEKNLLDNGVHWYTNRSHVRDALSSQSFLAADTAAKEVFVKTLAFFCALQEHGCAFNDTREFTTVTQGSDSDADANDEDGCVSPAETQRTAAVRRRCRIMSRPCRGQLTMRRDHFNRAFIQYVIYYENSSC